MILPRIICTCILVFFRAGNYHSKSALRVSVGSVCGIMQLGTVPKSFWKEYLSEANSSRSAINRFWSVPGIANVFRFWWNFYRGFNWRELASDRGERKRVLDGFYVCTSWKIERYVELFPADMERQRSFKVAANCTIFWQNETLDAEIGDVMMFLINRLLCFVNIVGAKILHRGQFLLKMELKSLNLFTLVGLIHLFVKNCNFLTERWKNRFGFAYNAVSFPDGIENCYFSIVVSR